MNLHCDQCAHPLADHANFCPVCGAPAPQVTRMTQPEKSDDAVIINRPIHCPACSELVELGHLYCGSCGAKVFDLSNQSKFYCFNCGAKNAGGAKVCYHCGSSIDDWRAQTGEIAEQIGYGGPLVLTETMTNQQIIPLTQQALTIGRNQAADIPLPCTYISKTHCELNFEDWVLKDLDSSNGTFIPGKGKIDSEPIQLTHDFNVAGLFNFRLTPGDNMTLLHLNQIVDTEDVLRNMLPRTPPDYFEKLKQTCWVIGTGDYKVYIRQFDGRVMTAPPEDQEYYEFSRHDDRYYLGTPESLNGTAKKIILKHYNEYWLPINWRVTMPREIG